jgi:spore protease
MASQSGLTVEGTQIGSIKINRVAVSNERASKSSGKAIGDYITMYCPEMDSDTEIGVLCNIISKMFPKSENAKTLVVGLGNENITPDSLGVRAAGKVLATAHFKKMENFHEQELNLSEVYVIQPGVMAQTGLESAQYVKSIADEINPDCLVVIDSLACGERERLGCTIQVTDTGISPGSGVKNERKEFSKDVFGVPVIAVGVPTVSIMRVCFHMAIF